MTFILSTNLLQGVGKMINFTTNVYVVSSKNDSQIQAKMI